jgi:hypothetical protein
MVRGLGSPHQNSQTLTHAAGVFTRTSIAVLLLCPLGHKLNPSRLGLIDNKWVIEYDSELFAGACIATTGYDLLKLKISFITAYPTEGTEKLWFVGVSSPEWTWIKSKTTYDFAIDTKRNSGEKKEWPLVFTGGQMDLCLQK